MADVLAVRDEELDFLMPWAPYIQQNFRIKNSDAYTNIYLN